MLVSFTDYTPEQRFDSSPWTQIKIDESSAKNGPWTLIETITISPVDSNPQFPAERSFTTDNATLTSGWYRVSFLDALANVQLFEPVYNSPTVEIMATLDDVNAHIDGEVVEADANNTALIQISVARTVRAYLSAMVDGATLMSWSTPETTPDAPREAASLLIAAQVYFNAMSATSLTLEDVSAAQKLYDRGMAILQGIIDGKIAITVEAPPESVDHLNALDFWPADDTDRAFSMGMEL